MMFYCSLSSQSKLYQKRMFFELAFTIFMQVLIALFVSMISILIALHTYLIFKNLTTCNFILFNFRGVLQLG